MNKENLIGQRHGRLVCIGKSTKGNNWWICVCDCGNQKEMIASRFKTYKSCGCLERENRKNIGKRTKTHGMTSSILYSKYCSMKARCYNPQYRYYHRYGGRGIKICDEWLGENGFLNFSKWAYDNGYNESLTGYDQSIDRINNNGDYEPNNCRWTNQKSQCRNRINTLTILHGDNLISLGEFCEINNVEYNWARRRLHKGQSAERILQDWKNKKKKK